MYSTSNFEILRTLWLRYAILLLSVLSSATAQTLQKRTLTLQGAEHVIAAARAEAHRVNAPGGVIAVVDDGGNLMALERLDGTFTNISNGEARTAVMFNEGGREGQSLRVRARGNLDFVSRRKTPGYYCRP